MGQATSLLQFSSYEYLKALLGKFNLQYTDIVFLFLFVFLGGGGMTLLSYLLTPVKLDFSTDLLNPGLSKGRNLKQLAMQKEKRKKELKFFVSSSL